MNEDGHIAFISSERGPKSGPRSALALVALSVFLAVSVGRAGAPSGRYVVPGDGTVHDLMTGLVWQQAAPNQDMNLAAAMTYCAGLNLPGEKWRLPSVLELLTLIDLSSSGMKIDEGIFSGSSMNDYLTAPVSGHFDSPWTVSFRHGYTTTLNSVDLPYAVRCVR